MTPEMLERLQLLAKLLLDARVAAAHVALTARVEGLRLEDYDLRPDIGALRERVRILMAQGEERS